MFRMIVRCGVAAAVLGLAPAAWSQTPAPSQTAANQVDTGSPPKQPEATPDYLVLYFASGSSAVRPQDRPLLDKAARLFRDAHPIIMIVAGGADSVGSSLANIVLSDARAQSVLRELVARGIPADRFQVLAKGTTDQAVKDPQGVVEPADRTVEIHWK